MVSWTVSGVRGRQRASAGVRAGRHCRTVSQSSHPEPVDKAAQALFDLSFWVVVEQGARLGNVGKGLWNIAWLWRLALNDRGHIELFLEQCDQFAELDGSRLAKIENVVVAVVVVNGCYHAVNDVVDVGVIAPRAAVTEDGYRFALCDQLREFMNGKVGALSWSIDREKAQAHAAQTVK